VVRAGAQHLARIQRRAGAGIARPEVAHGPARDAVDAALVLVQVDVAPHHAGAAHDLGEPLVRARRGTPDAGASRSDHGRERARGGRPGEARADLGRILAQRLVGQQEEAVARRLCERLLDADLGRAEQRRQIGVHALVAIPSCRPPDHRGADHR
jgi:hypothetical protein